MSTVADGEQWSTGADYAWAEGRDAFCVSLVEATSPEAVLRKMMVDGSATGFVSVAEARAWASRQIGQDDGSVIEAGIVGGWVVTVEANGYQATLPAAVHRISVGSRAVVVFRNVHGHTSFLYAVDGIVVRSFDPLLYDDPTPWDGPPLPEESGLDFGSGHAMASAFACAERLTGIRLTPELLDDHDDWLALGHHPLLSLRDAGSWPEVDKANAEGQAFEEDPRRRSIPNRLLWGKKVYDATDLFMPGWIGWVQLLLVGVAVAPIVAIQHGVGAERLEKLSQRDSLLVTLALFAFAIVLDRLIPIIGRMLERVARVIDRARKKRPAGRAEMADVTPQ
jgi:uncharacterized protein DUF6461